MILDTTGGFLIGAVTTAGRATALLFSSLIWIRSAPRLLPHILRQIDRAGFGSIGVLSLITALTGMIMVMAMGPSLERYGALDQLGPIIGGAFVRELGPIWAAVIVLARVGSSMAAELGTMTVNEEVEALKVMDVNPVRYLVLPRVVALILAMPLLTAIGDVVGLYGAAGIAQAAYGKPVLIFMRDAADFLTWSDFSGGLIKSVVFGATIAAIACDQGLNARGGADGVGRATTSAVRLSVIFVLVFDLILTSLFSARML